MNHYEPPSLLRNDVSGGRHWIKVKLEGVKSNRSAIGARVLVHYGGKKQVQVPAQMSVPRSPVNRNSGEHPLLGTDDIAYVLGVGPWTPDKKADKEKAQKHHEAFVALIGKATTETKDSALASCTLFYANAEEEEKARNALQEAKPGALVALSVGGALVEREAVRQFWRNHYQQP